MRTRFWVEPYTAKGTRSGKRYRVRWQSADGKRHAHRETFERKHDAEAVMADIKRRHALGTLRPPPRETLGGFLGVRVSGSRAELVGGGWLGRYRRRVRPKTFANAVEILPNLAPLLPVEIGQLRAQRVEDQVYSVAERAPRQAQVTL